MVSRRKIVIDTDAGVDDAVALFVALAAHKDPNTDFEIVAFTTVLGNTDVDNVGENVFKVLDCVGVTDIPVYPGSAIPIVQPFVPSENPHYGKDGFADLPSDTFSHLFTPKSNKLDKESAAAALSRLAREHKGELTIIALGPLTNIAIATHLDSGFVKNVKELYVMGGNIHGRGNVRPCVEFNFFVDPESAYFSLSCQWNKKIVIVPWEACTEGCPKLRWRQEILGALKCKPIQMMNILERKNFIRNQEWYGEGKWISSDVVCVLVLLDPEVIATKSENFCTVELQGSHTRGQMIIDHTRKSGIPHNAVIVEEINTSQMEKLLLHYFDFLS